ncbi:MAG: hypothetical protein IJT70_04325, partial [Clostridia bacterium]|nr:hypothetical protein [Clostridia bacterium]
MKKLLSLVIVAMMIVSCISNVFAVTADEVPASAPDNYVDLWLSDGVIDADDSVTLYVSVANNCGFWSMRYWIIYPDCLSVLNANHAILDEVLAGGGDATKGKQMTTATSSVATKGFQSLGLRAEDYLDGHHYMLADSIIVESVYDEDESGYYDVYGDGKLASFTFSYDASKNTEDLEKIPVLLFCDGLNRDHGELTDVFNDGTEEFLYRWYDGYVYVSAEAQAADTCAHANKSEVIVKQPSDGASNMNEGYRYIVCNDCGEKLQHIMWDGANYEPAPIEEHVHDYVLDEDASTPATCGENGENVYVCQGAGECDAPTYSEVVPATGEHTPGEAVDENVVPATCGEAGSKDVVVKCSVCGAELSRTPAEIPATGEHTPGEVVIENERAATCQAGGYYEEVVYCTGCGSEISRTPVETPVGEHVASDTAGKVLQSPTLTDPGVGAYRCEVCMAVVEDATVEIAPIDGFTYWTEDQTVEPGATVSVPLYVNTSQYGLDNFAALAFWDNAIGNGARVKMELGVFEEDDDITSGSTVATPTRDMINRMSKSGVSDEFDKSGKYFKSFFLDTSMESMRPRIGEGAIVSINFTAPAEEGEYKVGFVFYDKYCATWFLDDNYEYPADGDIDYNPYIRGQVAEATITVETPACQHENTYTVDENVTPATCGEAGYKEVVVYCSDCEEEISRTPTEIPATGEHPASDPVDENVTPATCGEAGSKEVVVYCSVCGTELSRT